MEGISNMSDEWLEWMVNGHHKNDYESYEIVPVEYKTAIDEALANGWGLYDMYPEYNAEEEHLYTLMPPVTNPYKDKRIDGHIYILDNVGQEVEIPTYILLPEARSIWIAEGPDMYLDDFYSRPVPLLF